MYHFILHDGDNGNNLCIPMNEDIEIQTVHAFVSVLGERYSLAGFCVAQHIIDQLMDNERYTISEQEKVEYEHLILAILRHSIHDGEYRPNTMNRKTNDGWKLVLHADMTQIPNDFDPRGLLNEENYSYEKALHANIKDLDVFSGIYQYLEDRQIVRPRYLLRFITPEISDDVFCYCVNKCKDHIKEYSDNVTDETKYAIVSMMIYLGMSRDIMEIDVKLRGKQFWRNREPLIPENDIKHWQDLASTKEIPSLKS
jgi:hypothetical protein